MSDYPIEFTLPGICHRWPYDGPIAAGHPYLATEGACCDLLIGDAHLIVTSLAQLDELEHALETIRDRARSWLPEGSAA